MHSSFYRFFPFRLPDYRICCWAFSFLAGIFAGSGVYYAHPSGNRQLCLVSLSGSSQLLGSLLCGLLPIALCWFLLRFPMGTGLVCPVLVGLGFLLSYVASMYLTELGFFGLFCFAVLVLGRMGCLLVLFWFLTRWESRENDAAPWDLLTACSSCILILLACDRVVCPWMLPFLIRFL